MKTKKTVTREKLVELLNMLAAKYRLFAPVRRDDIVAFAEIGKGDEPVFDFTNTREPPKKIFLPQSETLFAYDKTGSRHVPEQNEKKTVVFGIRPCDVRSFRLLDNVFNDPDYPDPYYERRRKNAVIIGLACNSPRNTCFCTSFGIGPFSRDGSDIFLSDLGGSFLVEALTDNGAGLLREMPGMTDTGAQDTRRAEELKAISEKKIRLRVETGGTADKLEKMFEHPLWNEIHEKCLCCGICSFLCPTCHCFDIADEAVDKGGRRVRTWDCCMFEHFTREASGHNPRATGRERMRQRVMHKFNYFVKNYGDTACVGCGRCLRNCPAGGDIVKIIEAVNNA